MTYDFTSVIERRGSGSLKWELYPDPDLLPMWVADMDFRAPPEVLAALRERVDHGIFGYTKPSEELVGAVLGRFRDRYHWPIEREWLVWLPGVVPGLLTSCRAFTEPEDDVVSFVPVYPPFLAVPKLTERRLISVPLSRDGDRYIMDPNALRQAITPRTRMLLLCHPHNPVGRAFSREELAAIAQVCCANGIVICSDEIHCDLVLNGADHIPMAALSPEIATASVTLMSPGKTFNTAGLNCALAVIPDRKLRTSFKQVCEHALPHPNALSYTACLAAYRDGEPWRRELIAVLQRNRNHVMQAVTEQMPGLSMTPVEATYLAWIDARALGKPDPAAFFRQAGVALSSGKPFMGEGFVRLNFGCPPALLERGLERMIKALRS